MSTHNMFLRRKHYVVGIHYKHLVEALLRVPTTYVFMEK